jgi:hypothetical protein
LTGQQSLRQTRNSQLSLAYTIMCKIMSHYTSVTLMSASPSHSIPGYNKQGFDDLIIVILHPGQVNDIIIFEVKFKFYLVLF